MKDLISVIVPVYNVEKYLAKCLDSLLDQTYRNLEIIVIDDCSTDESEKIIKKYLKKDKRIKFMKNKENSGLAFTRNVGVKSSTGKYIGFIDSDDYVSENYYEKMINAIKSEKAEIAITDIKVVYEDSEEEIISKCYEENISKLNIINTGLAASACNKLFLRKTLEYEFEVGKINEDIAVVVPAIVNSNKVSYAEDTYYHYLQRKASIQNSSFSSKRFDIFGAIELTLSRIEENSDFKKIEEILVFQQLISLLLYVIPKEKNILKRYFILRKCFNLLKKYDYKNNQLFIEFMNNRTKKESIFYKLLTSSSAFISNISITLYKTYRLLRNLTAKKIIKENITIEDIVKIAKKNQVKEEKINLSVVVPNYNYEKYMFERIYSILNQGVKISELLILDDMSTDNSKTLIDDVVDNLKEVMNIKSIYNETNSGSAFKQWEKGMNLASGDYVWIAEADDYSDKRFLKSVIKPIVNDNEVVISYADTAFIDAKGSICLKTIKHEIDIQKTGHWDSNYINSGIKEFNDYTYLNCTIANVSSAIIKKGDYQKIFKFAGTFKQAGDWVFYASLYQLGKVSFIAKQYNYYRLHGNNVSSTTKKDAHLKEIMKIHEHYEKEYGLNKKQKKEIQKRYAFLRRVWKLENEK